MILIVLVTVAVVRELHGQSLTIRRTRQTQTFVSENERLEDLFSVSSIENSSEHLR